MLRKIRLGLYLWFNLIFKIVLRRILEFHPANKLTVFRDRVKTIIEMISNIKSDYEYCL